VEKKIIREKRVDEGTIALNRLSEGKWEKLPTTKVAEDEEFSYFEAEAPGLSHFAVTGRAVPPPFPWWIVLMVAIIVAIGIFVGIYVKKRKGAKGGEKEGAHG
jgi:hypothetical protein